MIRIILVLLFIFKISASFSHSQLSEILPKDNVTYVKVPSQINMKFNSLVKLVKIVMIRVDKKEKINLDLTSLNDSAKEHTFPHYLPQWVFNLVLYVAFEILTY